MHHNQLWVNYQDFFLSIIKEKQNVVWKRLWIAIVWNIRKHKNSIIFRQGKIDTQEIWSMTQQNVWLWMKHKLTIVKFSYLDWCQCRTLCLKTLWKLEHIVKLHLFFILRTWNSVMHVLFIQRCANYLFSVVIIVMITVMQRYGVHCACCSFIKHNT